LNSWFCACKTGTQQLGPLVQFALVIVEMGPHEIWGKEAILLCQLAQTQWTHVQRLSPENKEVSPCVLLQAGYRGQKLKKKTRFNPYMLHAIL
jgi:hypothetical protein